MIKDLSRSRFLGKNIPGKRITQYKNLRGKKKRLIIQLY